MKIYQKMSKTIKIYQDLVKFINIYQHLSNVIKRYQNTVCCTHIVTVVVLFSSEEMFNQYSNGKIVGRVINCIKKKEHQYSFKVLAIMDGKSRMYYMTAFDKSNLFPFISFNEKDVDKKMHTIMGKEKTFTIAVKKTKEKVYYNVQSISKDD